MSKPFALIIDDDRSVAELFQLAMQDAGYQAEILDSGHKAQARLMFTTPDLVVLDLHIPNLSGEIILRQIRGQQRLAHTRVLITSGDGSAVERFKDLADGVLVKPVGYEELRKLAEAYASVSV
jgi:two-component system response regulator MtrA